MQIDIIAEVYIKTRKEGGRKTPYYPTSYWGQIKFENSEIDWSAHHTVENVEMVELGKTHIIGLTFNRVSQLHGKLSIDQEFLCREGGQIIGYGKIIEIKNELLCRSDD